MLKILRLPLIAFVAFLGIIGAATSAAAITPDRSYWKSGVVEVNSSTPNITASVQWFADKNESPGGIERFVPKAVQAPMPTVLSAPCHGYIQARFFNGAGTVIQTVTGQDTYNTATVNFTTGTYVQDGTNPRVEVKLFVYCVNPPPAGTGTGTKVIYN